MEVGGEGTEGQPHGFTSPHLCGTKLTCLPFQPILGLAWHEYFIGKSFFSIKSWRLKALLLEGPGGQPGIPPRVSGRRAGCRLSGAGDLRAEAPRPQLVLVGE